MTIRDDFEKFHRENPRVYIELVRLARDLVERGHRKLGIGMLWEVLRWETLRRTDTTRSSAFKLNDHYRSHYARLIMTSEADLADVFEVRELRSA